MCVHSTHVDPNLLPHATVASYKAKAATTDDEGKKTLITTTSAKAEAAITAFKAAPKDDKLRKVGNT
jgi:hypothetical protein